MLALEIVQPHERDVAALPHLITTLKEQLLDSYMPRASERGVVKSLTGGVVKLVRIVCHIPYGSDYDTLYHLRLLNPDAAIHQLVESLGMILLIECDYNRCLVKLFDKRHQDGFVVTLPFNRPATITPYTETTLH